MFTFCIWLILVFASLVCYSTTHPTGSECKIDSRECVLGSTGDEQDRLGRDFVKHLEELQHAEVQGKLLASDEYHQHLLLSEDDSWLSDRPTVPLLDIQSLHISGPSRNRVDLVFFSDGCTYVSTQIIARNDKDR